jgi:hypothetical protein
MNAIVVLGGLDANERAVATDHVHVLSLDTMMWQRVALANRDIVSATLFW